jgi:hypothetical protein
MPKPWCVYLPPYHVLPPHTPSTMRLEKAEFSKSCRDQWLALPRCCCEGYECKHFFIVSFLHFDVEVFQSTADSSVLSGRLTGVTLELGGLFCYLPMFYGMVLSNIFAKVIFETYQARTTPEGRRICSSIRRTHTPTPLVCFLAPFAAILIRTTRS